MNIQKNGVLAQMASLHALHLAQQRNEVGMNTEQFKREKLAGEYLNQYSIDGGSDYAASIFNAFCVGYTIAETPLLARIAELERQLANREPFVVKLPKEWNCTKDDPAEYQAMVLGGQQMMSDIKAAITAAGGRCV